MGVYPNLELGIDTEGARRIREIASEVCAFLRGEFTLTSGKKSNYYFDGKKVTMSPEGAYQLGKAIFDQLAGAEVDAVGGVPVGAYPMVAAVTLVSHLEGKPIPAFIVRGAQPIFGNCRAPLNLYDKLSATSTQVQNGLTPTLKACRYWHPVIHCMCMGLRQTKDNGCGGLKWTITGN